MRIPAAVLLSAFCLTSMSVRAETPVEKIENRLNACQNEKPGFTVGTAGCFSEARKAYEDEIEHKYQYLMSALDGRSGKLLADAQQKWLAFKEADSAVWGGPWSEHAGSIKVSNEAQAEYMRARARMIELDNLSVAVGEH